MSDEIPEAGGAGPKKKRLGVRGFVRATIIQRTAAVSWPEAKQMARREDPDHPAGPTDVISDSERCGPPPNRP
ncbi:MAG: hypothetical protein FJW90_06270 [Actinobacteria bacterium]|nr:hypothetical protein [Actinomycetota bacterium]